MRWIQRLMLVTLVSLPGQTTTISTGSVDSYACCKTCTVGKACGDTCIAKNKECHVGPGCACNG
jgi:hypothetical protein